MDQSWYESEKLIKVNSELESLSVLEIVSIYTKQAVAHRQAINRASSDDANAAYDVVWQCSKELRRRGPEAQQALLPLLNHSDPDVRVCAAKDALDFAPELGIAELERLAKSNYICGMNAQLILREWRRGTLRLA